MKTLANLSTTLCAALVLLGATALPAASAPFVEGQHYVKVDPPQPTETGNKIEVLEFFWYGCPHCYRLEPYVKRWLKTKPANVEFVRMPGIFSPRWMMHARAYYTAEVLGVVDKLHDPIFEAIHGARNPLDSEEAILQLFKQHGVLEADFKKVFLSFAVETKMQRASEMAMRYDLDGVPAVIVNGKYRTSASLAGSNAAVFQVVDQLIKMESK
jgi:thiol:disulfide interchange protein DsbA